MVSNIIYRQLPEDEVEEFRLWARQNYVCGDKIEELWHPVVRAECEHMNVEQIEMR